MKTLQDYVEALSESDSPPKNKYSVFPYGTNEVHKDAAHYLAPNSQSAKEMHIAHLAATTGETAKLSDFDTVNHTLDSRRSRAKGGNFFFPQLPEQS